MIMVQIEVHSESYYSLIRDLYSNVPTAEIAARLGVTSTAVGSAASRLGLVTPEANKRIRLMAHASKHAKYVCFNEHFFDTWSEPMAYVLGLLYADGCITVHTKGAVRPNGNLYPHDRFYCALWLHKQDLPLLKKVAMLVGAPEGKFISESKKDNCHVLTVQSRYMVERLIELGVVPRKSLLLDGRLPCIPDPFFPHWLRGFFDGDGSVGVYRRVGRQAYLQGKPSVSFLGRAGVLHDLRDRMLGFGLRVSRCTERSLSPDNYQVSITSEDGFQGIYDFMYPLGQYTICMERKRAKFLAGLAMLKDKYAVVGKSTYGHRKVVT